MTSINIDIDNSNRYALLLWIEKNNIKCGIVENELMFDNTVIGRHHYKITREKLIDIIHDAAIIEQKIDMMLRDEKILRRLCDDIRNINRIDVEA